MESIIARARRKLDDWLALRARARAALPELVAVLVGEFGVRRVLLFGSLTSDRPSDSPDIDLLVEGLDPRRRAEALGRLFAIAPLPVDLVPAETGRADVVRRALEDGEVLHEP